MTHARHSARNPWATAHRPGHVDGRLIRLALFAIACSGIAASVVWSIRNPPLIALVAHPVMREPVVIEAEARGPGVHGAMGQARFWQEAYQTGASADRIDFTFDGPVEIYGVLVSVDVWPDLSLVEFAVGVNAPTYGLAARDWLIHTSSTGGEDIDEHVWLATPMLLDEGDRVSVVAWVQNSGPDRQYVSPEVIVYYSVGSASDSRSRM